MTWASDDNLYTSWGDGYGFGGGNVGIGVARIQGDPDNFQGVNLWGIANGAGDGKSYGLLSVGGILYMWLGPGSGAETWTATTLYSSNDLGRSWHNHGRFFTQPDGFALPGFLNFGKDYAGARDGYIYSYAYDVSNPSYITKIKLARVPQDQITNRAAYEFFTGLDASGSPLWTTDVHQGIPVFEDSEGGVSVSAMIYNPALERYLFVVAHGNPSAPWQGGGLGIFDAPKPWGPWTTVEYTNNWMGSQGMFFANIPTKWISAEGRNFILVFTGTGSLDDPSQDAYQHIRGNFITSQVDVTLPDPPQSGQVFQ